VKVVKAKYSNSQGRCARRAHAWENRLPKTP